MACIHNAGKEKEMDNPYLPDEYKERLQKLANPFPTSFVELDKAEAEWEKAMDAQILVGKFHALIDNIMMSDDVADKSAAISALTSEFADRIKEIATKETGGLVNRAANFLREKLTSRDSHFLLVKNAHDEWVWFARYSNKWRDEDSPPEIISEASHTRFVDMVKQGMAPMPELWLWHVPGTAWGKAKWVGYDSSGHALAAGVIYPQFEEVAQALSHRSDILLSHGMPKSSIKRDANDPSIIVEHETREISPLPQWAAANKMTSFVLLKETTMDETRTKGISADDRRKLIEGLGIPGDVVDRMELDNAKAATLADESGLESKETENPEVITEDVEDVVVEEGVTEPELPVEELVEEDEVDETESAEEAPETVEDDEPSVSEVLGAIAESVKALTEAMSAMRDDIDGLQKSQSDLQQGLEGTPQASRAGWLKSIVGEEDALVDGRSKLARSKPDEAEASDSDGFFWRNFAD